LVAQLNGKILDDDRTKTTMDFISGYGYPLEQHWAYTSGFALGLQRIPYGRNGRRNVSNIIILQHGLMDTSATWVINSPQQSLAFILADNGYDVWLANSRGNKYADGNIYWDPSDNQFWAWNWDQHASIDIPTVIDYITSYTSIRTVSFVAHSQGATSAIACFSTNITAAKHVKVLVALAPVTYLYNQISPLLSSLSTLHADYILSLLGDRRFVPTPQALHTILGSVCTVTPAICNNVLGSLFGTSTQLNTSRIPVYTAHWPDSTSIQNLIHWIKSTRDKSYESYNGTSYFPQYIGTPLVVYYGDGDYLADPQDVQRLLTAAGSQAVYSKKISGYTHMDFTWSYTAASTIYQDMLSILQKFSL